MDFETLFFPRFHHVSGVFGENAYDIGKFFSFFYWKCVFLTLVVSVYVCVCRCYSKFVHLCVDTLKTRKEILLNAVDRTNAHPMILYFPLVNWNFSETFVASRGGSFGFWRLKLYFFYFSVAICKATEAIRQQSRLHEHTDAYWSSFYCYLRK